MLIAYHAHQIRLQGFNEKRGEMNMDLRHEKKHIIDPYDMITLRSRLGAVMTPDGHAESGRYKIRSLYFDDIRDTALREKLAGISVREKFRIRYYNEDISNIYLEKKTKINGLCNKLREKMTAEEVEYVISGDTERLKMIAIGASSRPLLSELVLKMETKGLAPKAVIEYMREPFTFDPGNVRVTLDYDIKSSLTCSEFLNARSLTVPVIDDPVILEIKWDEFLPSVIRDIVQLKGTRTTAYSKYAAGRMYG